jgi:multicomponent Na+:H+ antiporter subunit E
MPQSWNIPEPGVQPPPRFQSARSVIIQAAVLMGLWLLFSGHYDVFHISAGVLSVGAILLLNRSLYRVRLFPGDVHRALRIGRVVLYAFWLVKEIIVAALQVARIVLSPRMPVDPSLLEFHADLPNAGSQTILANSITLTPGTVTIDITHGVFLVHALSDISGEGLIEGIMPARVAHLYRGHETGAVSGVSITKRFEE